MNHDFYALTDGQKAECFAVLAVEALKHWGIEGAGLELLKQRENAVFAVNTAAGDKYALRIHRAGYHTDAELDAELYWMNSLNDFGVHTPEVIPAKDHQLFKVVSVDQVPEPRQVDLLGWVPGTPIGSIEEGVDDIGQAKTNYRLVGEMVARMHNFATSWQPPEGFERHAWDEEGLLGDQPWWGRFWELEALTDEQRELLEIARIKARAELADYGKCSDRYALLHADTLPENFLVAEDSTVRVIDFDDGGFGWLIFDFVTAMFYHLGEDYFDALLGAMVEGYQQHRPLPPQFEEKLPLFFMLRGFTYLGWAHTRNETDTAKELTPVLVESALALTKNYMQLDQVG